MILLMFADVCTLFCHDVSKMENTANLTQILTEPRDCNVGRPTWQNGMHIGLVMKKKDNKMADILAQNYIL